VPFQPSSRVPEPVPCGPTVSCELLAAANPDPVLGVQVPLFRGRSVVTAFSSPYVRAAKVRSRRSFSSSRVSLPSP
jgi:hypothetical protein